MTCRVILKPSVFGSNTDVLNQMDGRLDEILAELRANQQKSLDSIKNTSSSESDQVVSITVSMLELPDKIPSTLIGNAISLASNLQIVINALKAQSIRIKRGYDSKASENSLHKIGKAVDFSIDGKQSSEVVYIIEGLMNSGQITKGGVGLYSTHVHMDISEVFSKWTEQNQGNNEDEAPKAGEFNPTAKVYTASYPRPVSPVPIKNNYKRPNFTPAQSSVTVPAVDASGRQTTATIKSSDGSNSRWRVNFLYKSVGLENIDKLQPTQPIQEDYEIDPNKPWGPHWTKCRPPGLHKNARRCAKKNAVENMPQKFGDSRYKDPRYTIPEVIKLEEDLYDTFVTPTTGWQKTPEDKEEFWLAANAVFALETAGYVSIPQFDFDYRPNQNELERPLFNHFDEGDLYPIDPNRKRGKLVIDEKFRKINPQTGAPYRANRSVWGSWQYTSDTWQEDMEIMIPGVFRQRPEWVYVWLAPVRYEIGARLWRYKDIWDEVRSLEVGYPDKLHLAQKASLMYMFNHQPVIRSSFQAHFPVIRALNPQIQSVVEMFYVAWEHKTNGKTTWIPPGDNTNYETGHLGYLIGKRNYEKGVVVKSLDTRFRHNDVTR